MECDVYLHFTTIARKKRVSDATPPISAAHILYQATEWLFRQYIHGPSVRSSLFPSVTRRDSGKQFWAWYPMVGRQSRVEVSWICCCLESGSIFPGWLSWLSCVTWDGSCWPKSFGGLTATTVASTGEPSAVCKWEPGPASVQNALE